MGDKRGWLTPLVRRELLGLSLIQHGGDVLAAAKRYGLDPSDLLDFSSNVNPMGPPEGVLRVLRDNLWRIGVHPDPTSADAREAMAEYVGQVEPGNVLVTNGAIEALYLVAELFLERGDEALIVGPTFQEYEVAVRRMGGKVRHVVLRPPFLLDPQDVAEAMGSKTKLVFICNPNNPTGTGFDRRDLFRILDAASRKGAVLVIDECFMDFVQGWRDRSLAAKVEDYPNLVVVRSLTKFFAMPGLRIGYALACKELVELMQAAKAPWSVNALAQLAAIEALKDERYAESSRAFVAKERDRLAGLLKEACGVTVHPSATNFLLVDLNGKMNAGHLKDELIRRYHVLIRDCSSFKGLGNRYIRVCVRLREQDDRLVEGLSAVLSGPAMGGLKGHGA